MGTRSNLYASQPGTSATTLVTSPASTSTTITYARAKNTTANVLTLSATMSGIALDDITLGPYEGAMIFGVSGGTLNATQTLVMTASAANSINVKVDGYQVTTP